MAQLPTQARVPRLVHPENEWGWEEVLLSRIDYGVRLLFWQNTEDARKRNPQNRPTLNLPKFIEDIMPKEDDKHETEAHDIEDIKDILSRPRQSAIVKANEQIS